MDTKPIAEQIIMRAGEKSLEYLTKGVPAVTANGEPMFDEKGEPVRKAAGAADLRAALAVAKECERLAEKNGNTLGGSIKDVLSKVQARTQLKLANTGTDDIAE
jgi:hypothetical protein